MKHTVVAMTSVNKAISLPLEIWDCPGTTTLETLGAPLSSFATMIFVIDIQVSGSGSDSEGALSQYCALGYVWSANCEIAQPCDRILSGEPKY